MPKSAKKSSARSSPKPLSAARTKPSQEPARPTAPRPGGVSKEIATSKQTQLIAMLQSAPGATIAAMMQQTGFGARLPSWSRAQEAQVEAQLDEGRR
jgi:hypothetical protein